MPAGESRACIVRLLIAHRDQSSFNDLGLVFRALELSLRTIATPSQAIAQWSPVAT